jgi:toxin ParE1/3/4
MSGLRWSRRAATDLVEIGDFIAADDPVAARRWVERLRARAALAAATPLAGRKVPELDRDDVREVFARSYRIVYRVIARAIVAVTVFEGHRRFPRAGASRTPSDTGSPGK